jgi:hypothetical protein
MAPHFLSVKPLLGLPAMPRSFPRKLCQALVTLVFCGLVLSGCGSKEDAKTGEEASSADASGTGERTTHDDPAEQLKADVDDGIALLEKGDVVEFFERYAPLDALERMRREGRLEEISAEEKESIKGFFLPVLQSLKEGEIQFLDDDKSKAAIKPKAIPEEPEELSTPDLDLADPAEQEVPAYEGFPGDVQEAIKQAASALEAGDHEKFVENFFPSTELALATSAEGKEMLSTRLKEHPEMKERMIADLKALASLTPEVDAGETTATFQLNPKTPESRTIRFEKQGTWRLADGAKAIRTEMHKQSQQMLKPFKAETPREGTAEWIRIRDHWRISDIR